jgi:hypothetical protein
MKSRWMSWPGYVARLEDTRMQNKSAVGKLKVRDHLGDLRVDERTILKCIFE